MNVQLRKPIAESDDESIGFTVRDLLEPLGSKKRVKRVLQQHVPDAGSKSESGRRQRILELD